MKWPSYDKSVRERAKREKRHPVTVDLCRPDGSREIGFQGALKKEHARIIGDALLKVMELIGQEDARKDGHA